MFPDIARHPEHLWDCSVSRRMFFNVVQNNIGARSWWSWKWIGTLSGGALLMCGGLFWPHVSLGHYVSTRFCHIYVEIPKHVVSSRYFRILSVTGKQKKIKEKPGWLSLTSQNGMPDMKVHHRKNWTFKLENVIASVIIFSRCIFPNLSFILGGSGTSTPSLLAGMVFSFSFILIL